MAKTNVYYIPGLAFDKRIFQHIKLQADNVFYLEYIEPNKNEDILDYAKRMIEGLEFDPKEIHILVGHSFGGVLAQEISRIKKVDLIVLISSIKKRAELPWHFKIVAPLKIHRLFRKFPSVSTLPLWGPFHDYETKEERELVKSMINKQSNHYLRWALKSLSLWENHSDPSTYSLIHIHGKKDKTLLYNTLAKPIVTFDEGGHFLVFKKGKEISEIIKKEMDGLIEKA